MSIVNQKRNSNEYKQTMEESIHQYMSACKNKGYNEVLSIDPRIRNPQFI